MRRNAGAHLRVLLHLSSNCTQRLCFDCSAVPATRQALFWLGNGDKFRSTIVVTGRRNSIDFRYIGSGFQQDRPEERYFRLLSAAGDEASAAALRDASMRRPIGVENSQRVQKYSNSS